MSGPNLFFVKHLGEGSFGSVSLYQGLRYDGTMISVAVKTSDRQHAESLFREVQILSEFKGCPRIVQCYENRVTASLSQHGCVEYKLPLEYAPGGSLSSFVKQFKDSKLPDPMIRDFTRMLLQGLATIHAHGYVHCDLKPENILVFPSYYYSNENGAWRRSFELKISDFGLSRRDGDSSWWNPSRPFAGTSIYMSPDSVSYGQTGKDLDLWSLGCCVLEMYTGQGPWWHKNYQVDDLMMGQEPPIPSELPFEAKLFIMTCFAPRTKDATRLLKHIFVRADEGTQPSPVSEKIDLLLANFVRRNVSKTQGIRVPAAAQVMPNKTIMA